MPTRRGARGLHPRLPLARARLQGDGRSSPRLSDRGRRARLPQPPRGCGLRRRGGGAARAAACVRARRRVVPLARPGGAARAARRRARLALPLDRHVLVLRAGRGARAAGDPVSFGAGAERPALAGRRRGGRPLRPRRRLRAADAESAHGRRPRRRGRRRSRPRARTTVRASPLTEARLQPAVRGRGLRRLLLLARARDESRPHVPARPGAAAAELALAARRATTAAPEASSSAARTSCGRTASGRLRTRTRRRSARAAASTSSSSSASSSASPTSSASRCRSRRSPTTSSASSSSTTGARATSRRGSTCRSGPNLGKSFQTSVSAWVTPLALLEEARVEAPAQEPPPLPHLAGRPRLGARRRARGRAERRDDLARQRADALLDAAAAARARDLERRVAADGRPDGVGDDLRRRAGHPRAR